MIYQKDKAKGVVYKDITLPKDYNYWNLTASAFAPQVTPTPAPTAVPKK